MNLTQVKLLWQTTPVTIIVLSSKGYRTSLHNALAYRKNATITLDLPEPPQPCNKMIQLSVALLFKSLSSVIALALFKTL